MDNLSGKLTIHLQENGPPSFGEMVHLPPGNGPFTSGKWTIDLRKDWQFTSGKMVRCPITYTGKCFSSSGKRFDARKWSITSGKWTILSPGNCPFTSGIIVHKWIHLRENGPFASGIMVHSSPENGPFTSGKWTIYLRKWSIHPPEEWTIHQKRKWIDQCN